MMNNQKERNSGVDVAKILAMFLIVLLHVSNTGVAIPQGRLDLVFEKAVLVALGFIGVDLFALATGFLCVSSSYRAGRIIRLWRLAVFWGVVMTGVSCLVWGVCPGIARILKIFFPVLANQYWYFTEYFFLFLIIPFLNAAILGVSEKTLRRIILAGFVLLCVASCALQRDLFGTRWGTSVLWLAFAYVVGAYVRLYVKMVERPVFYLLLGLAISVLPSARELASVFMGCRIPGDSFRFVSFTSPFTFLGSILVFIGCVSIRIEKRFLVSCLSGLAATTFGIYLIHVQPVFYEFVWRPQLGKINIASNAVYMPFVIFLSIALFVVFALIEWARQKLSKGVESLSCHEAAKG